MRRACIEEKDKEIIRAHPSVINSKDFMRRACEKHKKNIRTPPLVINSMDVFLFFNIILETLVKKEKEKCQKYL